MNKLYIVIGAYGSGKSEYSVHLARKLKSEGFDVALADLDIVNPYFRTRDVREIFAEEGITVIAPEGQFKHADLPMISPRVIGAIENLEQSVILDVGGDPAGCRALGRFTEAIKKRGYEMLHVINTNRPFTSTKEEIIQMKEMLEFSSQLNVSEFVCNTNLMEYTNEEVVKQGIEIIQQSADELKIRFNTYLVLDKYINNVPDNIAQKRREIMTYTLMKPWENYLKAGI